MLQFSRESSLWTVNTAVKYYPEYGENTRVNELRCNTTPEFETSFFVIVFENIKNKTHTSFICLSSYCYKAQDDKKSPNGDKVRTARYVTERGWSDLVIYNTILVIRYVNYVVWQKMFIENFWQISYEKFPWK